MSNPTPDNLDVNKMPPTEDAENNLASKVPDKNADAKLAPTPQVTTNPGIKNY
ncbi:MAG: hypothetical protein ABI227_03930 [Rhodanobacter sp.]